MSSTHTQLRSVPPETLVMVDMDTGTMHNTNFKVINAELLNADEHTLETHEVFALAAEHGSDLWVADDDLAAAEQM